MDAIDLQDPPPTKRRRTDGASRDTILQTNATLQYLNGHKHNRWMQAVAHDAHSRHNVHDMVQTASPPTRQVDSHTNAARVNARNSSMSSANTLRKSTRDETSTVSALSPHARPLSRTAQQPRALSTLVQYETPEITAADPYGMPTPATTAEGSKSTTDGMSRRSSAQRGLPSPAPSDDAQNSPPLPETQYAQRRARPSTSQSRQPTGKAASSSQRTSILASPVTMSPAQQDWLHSFQFHQQQQPQSQVTANVAPSHASHAHSSSASRGQLPPDHHATNQGSGQPLRMPPVVPSNHTQAQLLPASRIPVNVLLSNLGQTEAKYAGTLQSTETGRLVLLREAVTKGDWFYQMTSQLFCASAVVAPSYLPQSVRNINPRCWDHLSQLLCPNTDIRAELLQFFASFPESLMDIYSDTYQTKEIYEMRLQSVKAFLAQLPAQYQEMVKKHKTMGVPPLVQDLVERLHVHSEILQTAMFRAITRIIYGHNASYLIGAMEKVHQLDQAAWIHHVQRRDLHAKNEAYAMLRRVSEQWTLHLRVGREAANFAVPRDVLTYFSQTPNQPVLQTVQNTAPPRIQSPSLQHQLPHHQLLLNRFTQVQTHSHPGSPNPISMPSPMASNQPLQYRMPGVVPAISPVNMGGLQQPLYLQGPRRLYPTSQEGPRAQPSQPDPARSGLHQAHLQSPRIACAEIKSENDRLYRHVIGFCLPPTRIEKTNFSQLANFRVADSIVDRVAQTSLEHDRERTRVIKEDSILFRLRCSVLPPGGFATESAWAVADNFWPDDICFELNGAKLETQRKLHHGRYLPVDLTDLIRAGDNTLTVSLMAKKHDKREIAIAVEVVGVTSHDAIIKKLTYIPAEDSLTAIKTSLSSGDDGDDELAFTSSTMTIKLFDPYSACKIFDIPARGASCLHKDCFDLQTFLSMCKRPRPDAPTVIDCWRCPLCRGDVRPQTLVVDGFLARVRDDLDKANALDTRAIVVKADGTWQAKQEKVTGVRSDSMDREDGNSMPPPAAIVSAPARPAIEVIDLESD